MKLIVIQLLCFSFLYTLIRFSNGDDHSDVSDQEWEEFKKLFKKTYNNKRVEGERRLLYQENKNLIRIHNAQFSVGTSTWRMKLNQYADWTIKEIQTVLYSPNFPARYTKQKNPIADIPNERKRRSHVRERRRDEVYHTLPNITSKQFISWRDFGAVDEVWDQGSICDSSWAFALTSIMATSIYRLIGQIRELSQQDLIACSVWTGGCSPPTELRDITDWVQNKKIELKATYPYTGKPCACERNPEDTIVPFQTVEVYKDQQDESQIERILKSKGTVLVRLHVDYELIFYDRGIIDTPCDSLRKPQYGVIVAMGESNEYISVQNVLFGISKLPYWTVKFSRGKDWGDGGYFHIQRNKNVFCVQDYFMTVYFGNSSWSPRYP